MTDNPKATRAYAWSSPIEGSDKRRFFAVLHLSEIRSQKMLREPLSWRNIGQELTDDNYARRPQIAYST